MVAHKRKIAVIGLGYVGLPVAVAFARSGVPVIGFDIDRKRVDELRAGRDRTREVEPAELALPGLRYEYDPAVHLPTLITDPLDIVSCRRPLLLR